MLWLALHLPQLSLEAFCATLAVELRTQPVALLAGPTVQAVNAAAAEQGVRPAIRRATALALAPHLLIAQADPGRDAAALLAVAHAALAFTPAVSLHGTQTVLLEVQASLRLFGGLAALRQRLLDGLAPLGHRVQLAAAPTALGAALLACWMPAGPEASADRVVQASADRVVQASADRVVQASAEPVAKATADRATQAPARFVIGPHARDLKVLQRWLARAPLGLLVTGTTEATGAAAVQVAGRPPAAIPAGRGAAEALQGMGLHTLGDLQALPRSGLARRFGQDLLDLLDRALGLQPDPRPWLEPAERFDSRLELYTRADNAEQVLQGAAVLLARLVAWAQARHARVGAFTLQMLHERQRQTTLPATELRVALAEPSLDAEHLQGLLRERLAQLVLAAPTLELRLHCRDLVAGHAPNGELFPTRASQAEGLTRLLERLRARLGDDQVQRLVPVADHRPEHASRGVPAQAAMAQGRSPSPAPALAGHQAELPLHRPVWLLTDPLPLAECEALPCLEGRPLQLVSGPERIESGWWDGDLALRDYFIAQAGDGSLVWIYRARLPGPPASSGDSSWFLQGRFG